MVLVMCAMLTAAIWIASTDAGPPEQNVVASAVGSTVAIPCNRSVRTLAVDWKFKSSLTGIEVRLCEEGRLIDNHGERYNITLTANDDYLFVIANAQVNDSGTYTCIEENGVGQQHSTALVVEGTESDPEKENAATSTVDQPSSTSSVGIIAGSMFVIIVLVIIAIMVLLWCLVRNNKVKLPWMTRIVNYVDEVTVPLKDLSQHHPALLDVLHTPDKAVGVTIIDDMIYVITERSNVIRVFSSRQPYSPHSDITVDDMKLPVDIVAWGPHKNEALWVADFDDRCVWKVNVDEKMCMRAWPTSKPLREMKSWLGLNSEKPSSLAAVPAGLAIVVLDPHPILIILGSDGQQKRSTNLDKRSIWLYGGVSSDLSIITIDSLPEISSPDESFIHRFHVSFDSQGRCFCCDRAKNCVYILSADLRQYRTLLSGGDGELIAPTKLHYSQSDGSLWVCDGSSVKLFRVTEEKMTKLLNKGLDAGKSTCCSSEHEPVKT